MEIFKRFKFDKVEISYKAINALEDKFGAFDLVNGEDKCYFDDEGREITDRHRISIEDYFDWDYIPQSKYFVIDEDGFDALKLTNEIVYRSPLLGIYVWAMCEGVGSHQLHSRYRPTETEKEDARKNTWYERGYDAGYDDGYDAAIEFVMKKLTEKGGVKNGKRD